MAIDKFDPDSLVLTLEEIQKVEKSLNTKFASWLKDRNFQVSATADENSAEVNVTLKNHNESFCYPIESRIMHKEQNVSKKESVMFLVDYIESYFDEYFREEERVYLPIDWMAYDCEGISFQIKGQVLNVCLDNLADRLLAGEVVSEEDISDYKANTSIQ